MKNGRLAQIRCRYCKAERYFRLEDLITAFGNIEVDDVIYQNRWRCTNCDQTDTLEINLGDPPAAKMQTMIVKRIERITYLRKVIWKDGSL